MLYLKLNEGQQGLTNINVPEFSLAGWLSIGSLILILSIFNWLLESLKWKLLINSFSKISFFDAVKQSLMAHSVALLTPFKAGEFGLKPLFYKKEDISKVVYLSFLTNASQLFSTVVFGVFGISYLSQYGVLRDLGFVEKHTRYLILLLVFCLVISSVVWRLVSQFKLVNLVCNSTHFNNIGLALLRYLLFSHQWVLLLLLLHPFLGYVSIISAVFTLYLIASVLPVFALFDWAIKGSVAVMLFSIWGVDASLIIAIALLLWMGNYLLPALFGAYFLIRFNPFKSKVHG